MKKLLVCGLGAGYDGVSNVIISFIENVDKSLFDVSVLETYDSAYHDRIEKSGCKIYRLPPFKKFFAYKKAVKKLFAEQHFDVVWINNTSKVDLQIMKNAHRFGAKVVTHSHGSVQEGGFLKRNAYKFLSCVNERKFYKYLNYGIACSQSSADYFYNKKYMADIPLKVLPNAINSVNFMFADEMRKKFRDELSLSENDVAMACIGRLCPVKNLGFALRVLQNLPPNYKLYFVGDGERDKLENDIKSLSLNDRAFLMGRRSDVSQLINAFDVILLPSISEGLPLTVLEAQANGMKCFVSANVGGDCKLLDSLEFLAIDNPETWAKAIMKADVSRTRDASEQIKLKNADIEEYTKMLTEIFFNVK